MLDDGLVDHGLVDHGLSPRRLSGRRWLRSGGQLSADTVELGFALACARGLGALARSAARTRVTYCRDPLSCSLVCLSVFLSVLVMTPGEPVTGFPVTG